LVGHVASMAAGCMYCRAHTANSALRHGVAADKLTAVAEYRTNPIFSEAERAALDFALAAASVPNDVSDACFARLRSFWSEGQIVEILGVISLFGFFNRWNDSLATTLEAEPHETANQVLGRTGWQLGKHKPDQKDEIR
jgi:alkylhydroperoxidase family enzyme